MRLGNCSRNVIWGVIRKMRESTFSNRPFTATAAARAPVALALIVLISALLPFNVLASAGDLDTSFGIGGKVTTVFPPSCCDRITSLARQADGKVIAGVLNPLGFAVVRYNNDGGLDLT